MNSIVSGFLGKAPKSNVTAPIADVEEDEAKAKKIRSRLFATEGGAAGQELEAGQVRGGFFGNS